MGATCCGSENPEAQLKFEKTPKTINKIEMFKDLSINSTTGNIADVGGTNPRHSGESNSAIKGTPRYEPSAIDIYYQDQN